MMTPEDIDALPEYSPTQRRKYWEYIERQIAEYGQSTGGGGKVFTRADMAAVHQNVLDARRDELQERNATNGGGIALVQFGEAQ